MTWKNMLNHRFELSRCITGTDISEFISIMRDSMTRPVTNQARLIWKLGERGRINSFV